MKTLASKMIALMACLLSLTLAGCVENEFSIKMQFPADYVGNYIVAYYACDSKNGAWLEQTASVQGGVAEIECVTHDPTLVYVSDASSPSKYMVTYAERGDKITITGDNSDMRTWKVTGNKIAVQWNEWQSQGPAAETAAKKNARIAAFVKKNPSSKLSAILLLTEFDRRKNTEEFVSLWNSVKPDARTPQLIEMCGSPDLPGVLLSPDADGNLKAAADKRLRSLVLRSEGNGVDTLPLAKKPSFLYFYRDNNDARREAVDSIKALVKAYPDSAKRIICDVAADIDSTTWKSSIRFDSLEKTVRAWVPHGLPDESLMKAGVMRLPWFRVASSDGKVAYSGTDLDEAVKAFRNRMKPKK